MRALVVVAFVGAWMALGVALRLGGNAYLLLGIPLTLAFQPTIARRPLAALWVADAPPAKWTALARVTTLVLAAMAVYTIVRSVMARQAVVAIYGVAELAGALAAGYAMAWLDKKAVRAGWPVVIAIVLGSALMVANARHAPRAVVFVGSLLQYLAVTFLVEEVTFRGALDSYVSARWPRWPSALITSLLWGPWHLPIIPRDHWKAPVLIAITITHTAMGVPLALAWRRARNLWLPAFAHSLIDALRNAVTA
jgi:membrane protease YdiL (CAAX protease family)